MAIIHKTNKNILSVEKKKTYRMSENRSCI